MYIQSIELRELRMHLVHPFETSFGRTTERHILIVKVSDGAIAGYGEVTAGEGPFYSPETAETAWYVLRDFLIPRALGQTIAGPEEFGRFSAGIRGHNMAKGGLEAALWDFHARSLGVPLWKLLGGTRERVACGVSIGIQPSIEALLKKIQVEVDAGYRRIKIKIKPGWDLDVVAEVRRAFPSVPLMGDANSAYTLADVPLFRKMDAYGLMMIEQPLHYEDILDHAELQKQIETPICLDESIHSADDARKAIRAGACRIVNIKLGRVGGHTAARAVHDVCREAGVSVWCGGMLESGIGRAHNVALSSLENFSLPGDVTASRRYWAEDIVSPPIEVSSDGHIDQRQTSGIGHDVNEDLMQRFTHRSQVFAA